MSLACTLAARDKGNQNEGNYAYWLSVAQIAANQTSDYGTDIENIADYSQRLSGAGTWVPDPPIDSIAHAVQFVRIPLDIDATWSRPITTLSASRARPRRYSSAEPPDSNRSRRTSCACTTSGRSILTRFSPLLGPLSLARARNA
jgi:hypothetical protein